MLGIGTGGGINKARAAQTQKRKGSVTVIPL